MGVGAASIPSPNENDAKTLRRKEARTNPFVAT
jgi:hypothetical protein